MPTDGSMVSARSDGLYRNHVKLLSRLEEPLADAAGDADPTYVDGCIDETRSRVRSAHDNRAVIGSERVHPPPTPRCYSEWTLPGEVPPSDGSSCGSDVR